MDIQTFLTFFFFFLFHSPLLSHFGNRKYAYLLSESIVLNFTVKSYNYKHGLDEEIKQKQMKIILFNKGLKKKKNKREKKKFK